MFNKKIVRPSYAIKPLYRNLVIIFIILAIILAGVILYFSLARATIQISPIYRNQQVGFAVQVIDKNKIQPDQDLSEKLPGEIFETSLEETQTFSANTYQVEQLKASGQITLINNYSKSQKLVATTRLLTPDNKLYRLTKFVEVPAGGQITAQAEADQTGVDYEIGSAKLIIPGLWPQLQDKIYAQTEGFKIQAQTKYLIDRPTLDNARLELKKQLIQKAKEQLTGQLSRGQKILDQSLVTEILKSSADAEVGSTDKEFSLTMAVGIQALVFEENRLKEIAVQNLPKIYKNNSLINILPDSFNFEVILLDANSENLIAQIKGEYTISIANIQIDKQKLVGLNKTEAADYLMKLNDVKAVNIILPFWTKFLPPLPDRINIEMTK